jgi:hypothetical protein
MRRPSAQIVRDGGDNEGEPIMTVLAKYGIALATVAAACATTFSSARADDPTGLGEARSSGRVVAQAAPVTPFEYAPRSDVVVREEAVPNAGLILSGSLMLGITYTSSLIVGASSERDSDKHLYVPLAGPWIDLADRGGCDDAGGTGCDNETRNKVLLVADGIFQGIGAAQIVGGFAFPRRRVVAKTADVRIVPNVGRAGYGLTASGTF